MKNVVKVLILAATCAAIYFGGSFFSALYAEYSHRGPNGEYLVSARTGEAWSAGVALVTTGILAFLLFRKRTRGLKTLA